MVRDFGFEFANYKGERGYVSGPSRRDYLRGQQDNGKGLRVVPVNVTPDAMRAIIDPTMHRARAAGSGVQDKRVDR